MSRFRIAVMMIVFVGCGLTAGVPPVRPGIGNLNFYHSFSAGPFAPTTHQLFLSKFVPQPFHGWWFRDSQLIASRTADDVRIIDLDPTQKLFIDYRAQNQNWFAQDEVQLFARDPVEVFITLKDPNRDFTDLQWKDETSLANLPRGVALVYPPQPVMPLDATGIFDVSPTPIGYIPLIPNFWPGGVPSGPGAAPNGKGSIKAARVVNHGLCSVELPYFTGLTNSPGFLELVSDGLFDGVVALQKLDGCIDVTRNFTHTLPILRQTQDQEDGQHGGFILDADFETVIHHGGATNQHVSVRGWFTFRLLDGLFSIESGALERVAATGTAADTVKTFVWNLLASPPFLRPRAGKSAGGATLADTVFQTAYDTQQYHGIDITADQNLIVKECHQDVIGSLINNAGADAVPTVASNPNDPLNATDACGNSNTLTSFLRSQVVNPAVLQGANLTPPLTMSEEEVIRAAVEATYEEKLMNTPHTFFRNVRCSLLKKPAAGQEGKARCEYILRAKRLVAHPDAMELVWLDYPREVSNPVYPIWLIVTAGGNPQARFANQLCKREPKPLDPPGGLHPFYPRPFTFVNRGPVTVPHTGSPCF